MHEHALFVVNIADERDQGIEIQVLEEPDVGCAFRIINVVRVLGIPRVAMFGP